jgi:hypothetical protein
MKKIKKLLTIGLAFLLTLCMGIGLTSCAPPTDSSNSSQASSSCEHSYEWVCNENGHQKVYTCGCPYSDIIELHTDNDNNHTCDICGYVDNQKDEPDKSIISLSEEIEIQFDLSQENSWWNSNSTVDFTDDKILICFKKTTTYPQLSIEDFNFENGESIEYISLRPTGGKYEITENFTQIAVINLKEKGRDRVIEAVRYFERISIIYCAEPNYIFSIE